VKTLRTERTRAGTVVNLGRSGFRHELVLHSSTEEMLEFVVPFAEEGVAAGEPTMLLVRREVAAAVLSRMKRPSHDLVILPALGQPGRGASDLRATEALLDGHVGRSRVRILNQEPTVPETHWHEWRRLEAGVNLALSRYDAWAVCVYDRRMLDDEMVDDLLATHPIAGHAGEHRDNGRYRDPVDFISTHMDAPPDEIEATPPAAELLDPSPRTARAAVAAFAIHSKLPPQEVENVVLATHEAVSNARRHGRPPVVLRLWVQPGRFTVTVTDSGTGPTNPFVGLLPPDHPNGAGLGLWISHQLVDVTHRRHRDGYTVRMTATDTCAADLH
jgi:anti-sigma regulatory factor (Ser/Thr protein kinase)